MDEFYRIPLSSGEALATLAVLRALHILTEGAEGILTDVDTRVWETAADRVAEELPDFISTQADRLGAAIALALRQGIATQADSFEFNERTKPPLPVQRTRTILENAQLSGSPVEIHYYVRSRDEWTKRRVDDIDVYEEDGSWYLAGHCELRDDQRLFRLDHIGDVRIVDETSKDRKKKPTASEEYIDSIQSGRRKSKGR